MMLSGQAPAMTLGQWIVLAGGGPRQPAPVAEATCQEVIVSQVRVHNFSVSLDGFGTGAGQSLEAPFGHAGTRQHEWFFPTRTFRAMQGQPGGSTGIDDAFAGSRQSLADQGVGACEACALVEPAGSCLVAAPEFEPAGGAPGRSGVVEGGGEQALDLVDGQRDEAGVGGR